MFDDIIHVCAAPAWCLLCARYVGTRVRHIPSRLQHNKDVVQRPLECSKGLALRCVAGHATDHIGTNDEACRAEEPSISSFAKPTNAHRPALNIAAREPSVQEMGRSVA